MTTNHDYRVTKSREGDFIILSFSDTTSGIEESSTFHAPWLWSNAPENVARTHEGQRVHSPSEYQGSLIESASITAAEDFIEMSIKDQPEFAKFKMDQTKICQNDVLVIPNPTPHNGCFHSINTFQPATCTSDNWKKPKDCDHWFLKVIWNDDQKSISFFDLEWLQVWRYDKVALERKRKSTEVTPYDTFIHRNMRDKNFSKPRYSGLQDFDYERLQMDEISEYQVTTKCDEFFRLLEAVFLEGAAIIRNAPLDYKESLSPLTKIGSSLGGLSHTSMYGNIFHVKPRIDASNIAYTTRPLAPHQDLAYYESKPGLQFLHCISTDNDHSGGESTLIDAMAAAHKFRDLAPEYFRVLATCSATFVKQRHDLQMSYQRPHIVLKVDDNMDDMNREIVAVNWSPPFEGPTVISSDKMQLYYKAYAAFEQILNDSLPNHAAHHALRDELSNYAKKFTWEYRLNPGEILVFNNARMLHGRRSFKGTKRHLVGAYTNMEDTLSKYRVMLRYRNIPTGLRRIPNVGNGSIYL